MSKLGICQVMEAVERFEDPLTAAKHIVQEAFRTWLRYEVRTDDITIIVIFIEGFVEGKHGAVSFYCEGASTHGDILKRSEKASQSVVVHAESCQCHEERPTVLLVVQYSSITPFTSFAHSAFASHCPHHSDTRFVCL